jgi:A118 family predicted phage portal protein
MFTKILQWLRERIDRMLNTQTLKTTMKVDVAISAPMAEALQIWCQMYQNEATWLTSDIKSLNLAAAISGEIARAVTIEMQVELTGGARADFLTEQLEPVLDKLRQQVEYGCAKGGLMLKPYVSDGKVLVDFVQADQFFPVSFDENGNITAVVFADTRQVGDKFYTRLEFHKMEGKGCRITNRAFKSTVKDNLGNECPLAEVEAWSKLELEATITPLEKPLFAYFRYPQANNIDPTSPLGVSAYARAVELIEQADRQWSDLLWEFDSGKRALYVDVLAFGKDSSGKPILPNKRLYRTLETGSAEGELFEAWSPDLREQNLLNGLEAILRKVEFTCGLAYGTLSNPQTVDKTATEIKISQQRSYVTISDTQKALEAALEQLLWAMDTWATLAKLASKGAYSTSYDWDDSVVVDKEVMFTQDLRLVTSSIMSKLEFRMRNMGEDEATAKKQLALVAADMQEQQDMFGQPTEQFGGQNG